MGSAGSRTLRKQDEVLAAVRERIISGYYSPGDPLAERALAEELGVSRLPIREALSKLERDGLVVIRPTRGAWVCEYNASNIESLYQVREAIEGMAARLAAERMHPGELARFRDPIQAITHASVPSETEILSNLGDQLHAAIIDGSGNSMIIDLGGSISDRFRLVRRISYVQAPFELSKVAARQHLRVIQAIVDKNPKLAEKHMREHISYWADVALRHMRGDVIKKVDGQ